MRVTLMSLPNDDGVESVVAGDGGLLWGAREGDVIFDSAQ